MGRSRARGDPPADGAPPPGAGQGAHGCDAADALSPLSRPPPAAGFPRAELDPTLPAAALDASIRYFVRPAGTAVAGLRFPIFAPQAATGATGPLPTNFLNTSGRRVTLAPIAGRSRLAAQWDPELQAAYTVLAGDWRLGVQDGGGGGADVMLGLSGTEFGRVEDGSVLRFVPGGPAYAPGFPDAGSSGGEALSAHCTGSAHPVTTSWIYLPGPTGPSGASGPAGGGYGYYSQPDLAGLYTSSPGDDFLRVLGLRAAVLPPGGTGPMGAPEASFPSVPYGGAIPPAGGDGTQLLREFETQVLTPARTSAIYAIAAAGLAGPVGAGGPTGASGPTGPGGGPTGPLGPSGPGVPAATPQGLLATFSPDLAEWWSLLLAQTGGQTLELTAVGDTLRAALLSNQLFLVISDPTVFAEGPGGEPPLVSLRYRFTAQSGLAAAAAGVPQAVLDRLWPILDATYASLSYFQHALRALLSAADYASAGARISTASEQASVSISGWSFDLGPGSWASASGEGTVLILKFADRSLDSLIDDLSLWTLPGRFNADPAAVQARLQAVAADARTRAATEPELGYFANTVLTSWNGVLFLDAAVPPSEFPPQLQGLAAGLDGGLLRAHHLGVNLSPVAVAGGAVVPGDASLFGLIDYSNPGDLRYQGQPYDFKVLTLRVLFANSRITSFASQVELMVAALFGEPTLLTGSTRGNNLVLNGVWQRHAGQESYAFSSSGAQTFAVDSRVVASLVVSQAQFATLPPAQAGAPGSVVSRFLLAGTLRFRPFDAFDPFSFGPLDEGADDGTGLRLSNLWVSMSFDPATPAARTFSFVAGQAVLDDAGSAARAGSLYSRFPLRLTGLAQGDAAALPASQGFIGVDAPVPGGVFGDSWYGLVMDLDLGSRGSLAAAGGFTATLLAAWSPAPQGAVVALGLRLPGSAGGQKSLSILGPLKLTLQQLFFFPRTPEGGYAMRLQNIALGFLGVSFPPGGGADATLFGNPDPAGDRTALGWYMAYRKDPGATAGTGGSSFAAVPPGTGERASRRLPAPPEGG